MKNSATDYRLPVVSALLFAAFASAAFAGPVPITNSTITVEYLNNGNLASYTGDRDFAGTSPSAATDLGVGSNIRVFQASNAYGRRLNVLLQTPDPAQQEEILGLDETLISHNYYKINNAAAFMPGIAADGALTVRIDNITFDQPVVVEESTALFHVFWDVNQSRLLDHPYHHPHNAHTIAAPFRNDDAFFDVGEFMEDPPHQVFGDMAPYWQILGSGTNELTLLATIPYSLLEHLDDQNHYVPAGLPAPHGFLEPFHFHFEYVVSAVPEPTSLGLLAVGGLAALLRRRRSI